VVSGTPVHFARLTYEEAERAAAGGAVLILPAGSTEPHGPHLPLDTDVVISEAMAIRAVGLLRGRGGDAYVLPPISYAVTDFARGFGGAVSISRATATAVIAEACVALIRQGFARIAIASAHLEPAHLASIRDAVAWVRSETQIDVLFPDITSKRWGRMLSEEFRSGACHAGRFETSIVMARRAGDVRESVRATLPATTISLSRMIKDGVGSFRDAGIDRAYCGDPASATADEGSASIDTLALILATAITEGRSE